MGRSGGGGKREGTRERVTIERQDSKTRTIVSAERSEKKKNQRWTLRKRLFEKVPGPEAPKEGIESRVWEGGGWVL